MRLLVPLLVLTACGGADDDAVVDTDPVDTVVATRTYTLKFAGVVGDEAFDCRKSYDDVGAAFSTVRVTDLRLYVHDVALKTADGALHPLALAADAPWQDGTVALVDLEDGVESCRDFGTEGTNDVVVGDAPDLDYTGLVFRIGVPSAANHPTTPSPAPLDVASMFRNATAGFWFFRTGFTSSGQPDGWPAWIGSTGCTTGEGGVPSCTSENVVEVSLDGFDPDTSKVVIDVGGLVDRADLEHNAAAGPAGCQSMVDDDDCRVVIFPAYGLSTTPPAWIRVE